MIDVIIHNQDKIIDTKVIGCPFSDHHFLIAALDFTPVKAKPFENIGRSLSEKNLILIVDHINALKFSFNRDDDFKNNKKYWEFYSISIKIKSCKSEDFLPSVFIHEFLEYSDSE